MQKIIIILILFCSFLYSDSNINISKEKNISSLVSNTSVSTTQKNINTNSLSKSQLEDVVKNKTNEMLNHEKSWMLNLITYGLVAITIIIALYGVFNEFRFKKDIENNIEKSKKYIKNALEYEFKKIIDNLVKEQVEKIITQNIKTNVNIYSKKITKKEYAKNILLYDINKWFATKLKDAKNESERIEAHNWYNDRFFIVTKLTYGEKEKILRTLKELKGSATIDLMDLVSFKKFLKILSNEDIEYDTIINEIVIEYL